MSLFSASLKPGNTMPESTPVPESNDFSHFVRVLPDPMICRTKPILNIETLAECLVPSPVGCPYVFDFKYCTHPHWRDFTER